VPGDPGPRHAFHFSPRSGWMNDPNGLVERDGVHHLFFQHNPDAPVHANMHWGHATSTDLLTWTEQPIALTPGDAGDYDRDGVFSGCAVTLDTGGVVLVYSAHRDGRQLPAIATTSDPTLNRWVKSPANPVATIPAELGLTDHRDHSVLRAGDRWRQVLAAGVDTVTTGTRDGGPGVDGFGGSLISFLSDRDDLTAWSFEGTLLEGREVGIPGEVWECPDVFVPPGAAGEEVAVIMSWYTRTADAAGWQDFDVLWLSGTLHDDGRFNPARHGRLDLGRHLFYAPQSYTTSDGRRLMFGWLRTHVDPATAGQPAVGAATLPRALELRDGRLTQQPAAELDALARLDLGRLRADSPPLEVRPPARGLDLRVRADSNAGLAAVEVVLSDDDGHQSAVSLARFGDSSTWSRTADGWVAELPTTTQATILLDAGLVEVFGDDGRASSASDLALGPVSGVSLGAGTPEGVEVTVRSLSTGR
jgi:beta-fructofuranosidase